MGTRHTRRGRRFGRITPARLPGGMVLSECDRAISDAFADIPLVYYQLVTKSGNMTVTEMLVHVLNTFHCNVRLTAHHYSITVRDLCKAIRAAGIVMPD